MYNQNGPAGTRGAVRGWGIDGLALPKGLPRGGTPKEGGSTYASTTALL